MAQEILTIWSLKEGLYDTMAVDIPTWMGGISQGPIPKLKTADN